MKRGLLFTLLVFATVCFGALGIWQLERRVWKLDLISRVETRVHAPPVEIPPRSLWSKVNPQKYEYRRVRLRGYFDHRRATLVDALTEKGPGFWVLTPLNIKGGTVLVNRGFVTPAHKRKHFLPGGEVRVIGLMRFSEPEGRVLRPNRPEADLWYSRDIAAIAEKRRLGPVAPFFVDAEKTRAGLYPVGGLTVTQFRNAHLIYALTWLGLSLMSGFGAWHTLSRRNPKFLN